MPSLNPSSSSVKVKKLCKHLAVFTLSSSLATFRVFGSGPNTEIHLVFLKWVSLESKNELRESRDMDAIKDGQGNSYIDKIANWNPLEFEE